jgi:hypothetical protein
MPNKQGKARFTESIWIIQEKEEDQWYPTSSVILSRADGRAMLHCWRKANPEISPDRFRLVKYVPAKS